jgi:CBS domain-containing membrane protein
MAITRVREVMRQVGPVLNDRDTLATARARLAELRVQQLPVADREGRFVGLVTRYRLASAWPHRAPTSDQSPDDARIDDLIDRQPLVVGPEATAAHAAYLLGRCPLNCLPVVDRGKLVGIVTKSAFVHFEQRYVERRLADQDAPVSARPAAGWNASTA